MARITVEDCLKKIPNRFMIALMTAKRVRQLREGSEYLVSSPKNEDIVIGLREIAAGKIFLKDPSEVEEELELENAEDTEEVPTEETESVETPEEPENATEEASTDE